VLCVNTYRVSSVARKLRFPTKSLLPPTPPALDLAGVLTCRKGPAFKACFTLSPQQETEIWLIENRHTWQLHMDRNINQNRGYLWFFFILIIIKSLGFHVPILNLEIIQCNMRSITCRIACYLPCPCCRTEGDMSLDS
jgi:hypothetical protein